MTLLATLELESIGDHPTLKTSLNAFLSYSSHKILAQALPTFFDGFLPAQRRLLLALQDLSAWPTSKLQKSSRVDAAALSNYHPAGSAYGVLVNMSQDWKVQALLTDPEGNWGTIEGGQEAALRYTETRLSKFGEEVIFRDMPSKRHGADDTPHTIVPSTLSYQDLFWEEDYLPVRLPMLLINGSSGIAVGLAQDWVPLAIKPMIGELRNFLKKGKIDYTKLRLGFPTQPSITSSQEDFISVIKTGRGSVRSSAPYSLTKNKRGDVTAAVFTAAPADLNLNDAGDAFNEWASKDEACPFASYDNESGKGTIRLVFPLKKATPEADMPALIATLVKKTKLSQFSTVNMMALKDRFPIQYTLERFFTDWLEERSNITQRVAAERLTDLRAAWRRINILVWVRDNFNLVAKTLREAENATAIKDTLDPRWQKTFVDTPMISDDVDVLLEINLRQVSRLSDDEVNKRIQKIKGEITHNEALVNDPEARKADTDADLQWFLTNFEKLGLRDTPCEFDPAYGELLDNTKIIKLTLNGAPKAAAPTAPDGKWWLSSVGKAADTDIVIYTEKGTLIRVSTRSVKGEGNPFTPGIVDPDDKIVGAFFHCAPTLLLLADNERLIQIAKDALPYNQPVYPAGISQRLKQAKTFTTIIPAVASHDNPKDLLFIGDTGLARRTPLAEIPSLRTGSDYPGPVKYLALVNGDVTGFSFDSPLPHTLKMDRVSTGSLKRTKLRQLSVFGYCQRFENGNGIRVTDDRRSIFKGT